MDTEITCKMRPVYRVGKKNSLTLWAACLRKAKLDLMKEYGFDFSDGFKCHYSLMKVQAGIEEFIECNSAADAADENACFNSKKWTKLKRERAHQYLKEWKDTQS